MYRGKDKCKLLKDIRRRVAQRYGLDFETEECYFLGECVGTCPRCDAELRDLQKQLDEKGVADVAMAEMEEEYEQRLKLLQPLKSDKRKMPEELGGKPAWKPEKRGESLLGEPEALAEELIPKKRSKPLLGKIAVLKNKSFWRTMGIITRDEEDE